MAGVPSPAVSGLPPATHCFIATDNSAMETSPTQQTAYSFARSDSIGSIPGHSSASSARNTDDEDSDGILPQTYRDRRREAHTQAEQKRRDAIKKGYDDLEAMLPKRESADNLATQQKLSKALTLQRSIDYIQLLEKRKGELIEEKTKLEKEVEGLSIMKRNFEHLVHDNENMPQAGNQVSDEVKFLVFQKFMDDLFQTFNASISVTNFSELSITVFSWLEEYCKPLTLRDMTMNILTQMNAQLQHQ